MYIQCEKPMVASNASIAKVATSKLFRPEFLFSENFMNKSNGLVYSQYSGYFLPINGMAKRIRD